MTRPTPIEPYDIKLKSRAELKDLSGRTLPRSTLQVYYQYEDGSVQAQKSGDPVTFHIAPDVLAMFTRIPQRSNTRRIPSGHRR